MRCGRGSGEGDFGFCPAFAGHAFAWIGEGIFLCYAMFAKPMKISPSTIAGVLVATMVVGFLCGLVYVVNYLLSQR